MAKIIILKGPEQVGKSSTLRILIGKLLKTPGVKLLYPDQSDLDRAFATDDDCLAIFELADGRKVGVITWGDPGYAEKVQNCVDICLSHQCDVVVGAARSYLKPGSVFEVLYNLGALPGNLLVVTTPFIVHNPPLDLTGNKRTQFYIPYNTACADSIYTII